MDYSSLRLIVGLGNPGPEYRHNRHNLGFMVIEELERRLGLNFQAEGATYSVAVDRVRNPSLVLLKPMSYMNRSGQAVLDWARQAQVTVTGRPAEVMVETDDEGAEVIVHQDLPAGVRPLVICDDLNLPLGSVRLRPSGSSGGQNGLESVIEHLSGEVFPRLRLGIAPAGREIAPEAWPDFVLADFEPAELALAAELVDHAAAALIFWLEHGLDDTISRFNRRIRPTPE